jgi:hypothetical protein
MEYIGCSLEGKSKIWRAESPMELKLRHGLVAIIFTGERTEGALQFTEGRWGCVVGHDDRDGEG